MTFLGLVQLVMDRVTLGLISFGGVYLDFGLVYVMLYTLQYT